MIVPMKKVSVIVLAGESEAAVAQLRKLGVLHVQYLQQPVSPAISTLGEDLNLVDSALAVLSQEEYSAKICASTDNEPQDYQLAALHIVDSHKRIDQLNEHRRNMHARIAQWQRWGDFDPRQIQALGGKGINFKLYQIPHKELSRLSGNVTLQNIFTHAGFAHCVVISKGPIELPFKEIALPMMSLTDMRRRSAEDERAVKLIKEDLKKHACYRAGLLRYKDKLELELEFRKAIKGMGEAGSIMYISGYIPFDCADRLSNACRSNKWALAIDEPSADEQVPTLVRNPRWVSLISPVFKLIEIVPGYRELDISLWFLIFFSIFFGMLIGDAAYGGIYFILTFLAQKKWGAKVKDNSVFFLFYLLSFCAIIWGVLSGTFFGQAWLPASVKPLIPALRNGQNVQSLCFLIGALHLSIAHLWRAVLKAPSPKALADLGWVSVLWGAFFLARTLILGFVFPDSAKWLIVSGACAVVIFTNPRWNILKGIGSGIGNLLLNVVNNFTDIVSYIRLFAVGLATVAVADAFNSMALGIGFKGIISGIATSLILILGHTLNILLGPMSMLVHGVRLNVLEFCNHLDIKWSGFAYRPLREDKGTI